MAELVKEHHKKDDVAYDRPGYREGRWEKAVKVYTVNQESRYLLVQNVHALGVVKDLLELFSLYGEIEEYRLLDEYPTEPYTDVYWIKYVNIQAARIAKKKLDNSSFFGKQLHVCYAPEFENVQDTREKLQQRRRTIALKTQGTFEKAKKELVAQTTTRAGTSGWGGSDTAIPSSQSDQISHSTEVTDRLSHSSWYSVPNLPPLPLLPPPPQSQMNPPSQPHNELLQPPFPHARVHPVSEGLQSSKHSQLVKDSSCHTVTRKRGNGNRREDTSAVGQTLYDPSGLSQQERVSVYLQTTDPTESGFQDVTSSATNQNPSRFATSHAGTSGGGGYCSKLVQRHALIEQQTGRDSFVSGGGMSTSGGGMSTGSASGGGVSTGSASGGGVSTGSASGGGMSTGSTRGGGMSTGSTRGGGMSTGGDHRQLSRMVESPRLKASTPQSGSRSVDSTVQAVRAKMAKVWDQPPLLAKPKTAKKRKRI